MKFVLSLGAGKEQIPLLQAIRAAEFGVMGVDSNPDAPGKEHCDRFFNVSNRDVEGILRLPLLDVFGVMAAASEVPDVMAVLQHRLRLPGMPVATGFLMKDKFLYKRVLKAAGVPHTEAHEVYGGNVKALFDQLRYEVVVKPRSGSGSKGVFRCLHDPMGLIGQMADAADADHSGLIMERYQPGPEISSESVIFNGDCITTGFVDRFYADFAKEVGGSSPSYWAKMQPEANKVIHAAARALGITKGTLKCDLVLTEDGPKIIELTPRLSGGPLWKLIIESSGIDHLGLAVQLATGRHPTWSECEPLFTRRVAVDMHGEPMDWDESRKYVKTELGKCV